MLGACFQAAAKLNHRGTPIDIAAQIAVEIRRGVTKAAPLDANDHVSLLDVPASKQMSKQAHLTVCPVATPLETPVSEHTHGSLGTQTCTYGSKAQCDSGPPHAGAGKDGHHCWVLLGKQTLPIGSQLQVALRRVGEQMDRRT